MTTSSVNLRIALVTIATATSLAAPVLAQDAAVDDDLSSAARFTPTFAFDTGFYGEVQRFELEGATYDETRTRWASHILLGVEYAVADSRMFGASELGAGLIYASGQWPVLLRQTFGLERSTGRRSTVSIGARVGAQINVTDPTFSFVDLGVRFSVRYGIAELSYVPAIPIALGRETSSVFGGEAVHRVRTGSPTHSVVIRFELRSLAW